MSDFLSNIELYFSPPRHHSDDTILIEGDEHRHLFKVMRHRKDDTIFVTDGAGNIFKSTVTYIDKERTEASPQKTFSYKNKFSGMRLCLPVLSNSGRMEFAVEKCVEFGFTEIALYDAERSVRQKVKHGRLNKIALAAMKQSLRSFLPVIRNAGSIGDITNDETEVIYFDQNAQEHFNAFIPAEGNKYSFVIGPEGGFTETESDLLNKGKGFMLTHNRLRSETAAITAALSLNQKIEVRSTR